MPRASWKGFLRLSLVSCPIYLSPATTRTKSIRLHQVWQPKAARQDPDEGEPAGRPDTRSFSEDSGDDTAPEGMAATRVSLLPHDPHTGAEIERGEVVKGYEYERGGFVTFTAEELKPLDIQSSKIIDLESFGPRGEVDPVYFSTPYYVYPDGVIAVETFRVIGAAMAEAGAAGIGRVTLSRRERLVMVEPRDAGMVLITLRASEEVRPVRQGRDGDRRRPGGDRRDDHQTRQWPFRPRDLPGSVSGGAARADRGEDERPAGQAETDRNAGAGARSDERAQAQPDAGNRHRGEAKTPGGRR
jgi:Ku70/Ku80 beta-barrel domain